MSERCEKCGRATLYGRHTNNRECLPWWFDDEPHIAHDGRVSCPHCTMVLGLNLDRAKQRSVFHEVMMCRAWAEMVRADVDAGVYDEALMRGEVTLDR